MVLVHHILDPARTRLAVLSCAGSLCDAAAILANPDTPLVVVCNSDRIVAGVITRSDIVKVLASARADALDLNAEAIMTTPVLSCHVDETLDQVWATLCSRSLRCAPIVDDEGRPQGVVHARDVASALLDEVTHEEVLLRDYVLGVGYQ